MRQFYWLIEKGAPSGHQLSWRHYRELIPLKDVNEIKYYINICKQLNLTRDELKLRIKNNRRRKDNKYIIEYCSDDRIISGKYKLA